MRWQLAEKPSQDGKLAVVTGTGGLGFEAARELVGLGAEVLLAGRSASKGAEAVARIRSEHPAGHIDFAELDLSELASVHGFAERLLTAGRPLDLLLNNAGVMALPERRTTKDGFELQLGTNFLGHFALTARLLPLLRAGRARVVTVSSLAHRGGRIDFDDLQSEKRYAPWRAYQQSKLADLLFALELQRRSEASGWGLASYAAHPGYALTELIPNGPGTKGALAAFSRFLQPFTAQSPAEGALPLLHAAIAPSARPGAYFGPSSLYELRGPVKEAWVAPRARDRAVAERLWNVAEELVGVRFGERSVGAAA